MATDETDLALQPVKVNTAPGPEYGPQTRPFQGIPGIERAPGGRLWATWYGGGPTEGPWNYVMLVTSDDDGETWSDLKAVVDPAETVRTFDPALWVDPEGRLWWFWAQAWDFWDGRAGVWATVTEDPDSENPTWSEPRRLCDGVMMNKPTALSDGTWLLPAAVWSMKPMVKHPSRAFDLGKLSGSNAVGSTDQGETWEYFGGSQTPLRACDEHMIVEKRDGSLWTLVRTNYGIGESISRDGGKTWTPGKPSWIPHVPHARFFIRRLNSGKLLLVKHTPPDQQTRSHLKAFLSDDDGKTWYGEMLVDERRGVSYPDGVQAPDGTIYLIYDFSRQGEKQIFMATFTEEDVAAGDGVSEKFRQRVLVNQSTGVMPVEERALGQNEDGEPALTGELATVEVLEGETDILVEGVKLFTNRKYVAKTLPDLLDGKPFVRCSMEHSKVVCREAGVVFVVTPLMERNKDNVEVALYRKGFVKVREPEFQLFDTAPANICSVFQKELAEGEELELGMWRVVVAKPAE